MVRFSCPARSIRQSPPRCEESRRLTPRSPAAAGSRYRPRVGLPRLQQASSGTVWVAGRFQPCRHVAEPNRPWVDWRLGLGRGQCGSLAVRAAGSRARPSWVAGCHGRQSRSGRICGRLQSCWAVRRESGLRSRRRCENVLLRKTRQNIRPLAPVPRLCAPRSIWQEWQCLRPLPWRHRARIASGPEVWKLPSGTADACPLPAAQAESNMATAPPGSACGCARRAA